MPWLELPGDFSPHTMAEFFEAELLLSDDDYLSASEIRGLFPSGQQPTVIDLENAFAEIERRAVEFGRRYPFTAVDRGILFDRPGDHELYSALLLLSLKGMPVRVDSDYPRSDPVFDAICEVAFRNSGGVGAKSLVFAWPPRGGRPTDFPKAVKWAAERIGVETRGGTISSQPRDAGVDVVVWRAYPDGRNGFAILLAQNTIQFSFRKKPRDVKPSQWFAWLNIGAHPNVGFAVPFLIPDGDIWWDEIILDVHLVLDRGRILHEFDMFDLATWGAYESVKSFVEDEVDLYKKGIGAVPGGAVPKKRKKKS